MSKQQVFVYGTLKFLNVVNSPKKPDTISGFMADLGKFPAILLPESSPYPVADIEGYLVGVTPTELDMLDAYESVGTGLYIRKKVTTKAGISAWVYEYGRDAAELKGLKGITNWPSETGKLFWGGKRR